MIRMGGVGPALALSPISFARNSCPHSLRRRGAAGRGQPLGGEEPQPLLRGVQQPIAPLQPVVTAGKALHPWAMSHDRPAKGSDEWWADGVAKHTVVGLEPRVEALPL
eukprot:CAMPEP_0117651354 /NCGR_PEP_ID=MMETSP0804-20121206/2047_1 /TAXON_ID=1074897 /ORGANISM="Tetraselmis astigmatica, Strain CCMP880" /LENGTH=107 /DNA_ID=CAMNT_0005457325 /DNA_START=317 /DNA_END=637 /DNA_ORIENTATION=-